MGARRTVQAVKAFQKANGLKQDGVVGPLTQQALTGSPSTSGASTAAENSLLVWYEEAFNLIGTRERPGPGSNRKLLQWAKDLNIDYEDDDIPWCGLFVGHCIGATLPDEESPVRLLSARSWRRFGESCAPMRGAVLVFWRGSPEGGLGHVGFYHSEDKDAYHLLGGNQSNAVSLARVSKKRLLAARWPRSAALLTGAVVTAKGEGKLSHDES